MSGGREREPCLGLEGTLVMLRVYGVETKYLGEIKARRYSRPTQFP